MADVEMVVELSERLKRTHVDMADSDSPKDDDSPPKKIKAKESRGRTWQATVSSSGLFRRSLGPDRRDSSRNRSLSPLRRASSD